MSDFILCHHQAYKLYAEADKSMKSCQWNGGVPASCIMNASRLQVVAAEVANQIKGELVPLRFLPHHPDHTTGTSPNGNSSCVLCTVERSFILSYLPSPLLSPPLIALSLQEFQLSVFAGCIVVGHGLHNDLVRLGLKHPSVLMRDTYRCKAFHVEGQKRTLKFLAQKHLGLTIQRGSGRHCAK